MESDKRLSIIYHFPCFDGAFAAINTFLYYSNFARTKYIIQFIPIQNTTSKIEALKNANKVILLDLSLSEEEYDYLMEHQDISVIMIDHHISGINLYKKSEEKLSKRSKKIKAILNEKNNESACGLSFRYYKTKAEKKDNKDTVDSIYSNNYYEINKYVEDGDTGAFMLKNINEFRSGVIKQYHPIESICDFSKPNYINKINNLLDLNLKFTIRTGEKSCRQFHQKAKSCLLRNKVYLIQLQDDIKFLCIILENKQYRNILCPFLGKISLKYGFLPIGGCVYHFERDLYKMSLRTSTKGAYDVSKICSKFGGGGHADAASFTMTFPEIKKIIVREISIENEINKL